jgi:hypothetical protein
VNERIVVPGFALAVTVLAATAVGADAPKHLLARWTFDEEQQGRVLDASGNGHHGQMRAVEVGAGPARVDGMVGKAIRLRAALGTDVLVKRDPRLDPGSGLTIAAWIKHEGPIGAAAEIVGKKGLASTIVDGYRFCVSRIGSLCLEIGDGKSVSRVQTERRTIRPDTWYFVAATFSPGRVQLYVNARLVVDQEVSAQRIAPSTNHLVIGNFAGRRNAMPFNGLVDEVHLLGVALDGDSIFRLAKAGELRE